MRVYTVGLPTTENSPAEGKGRGSRNETAADAATAENALGRGNDGAIR